MKKKLVSLILVNVAIYALAVFIELNFLYSDEMYFRSFNGRLTDQELSDLIQFDRSTEWLNYLFILPYMAGIILFTLLTIWIGTFFSSGEKRIKYIMTSAAEAHIVFSLSYLILIVIKIFILKPQMMDIENSDFQSILWLFKNQNLPLVLLNILKFVTITQLCYIFLLTWRLFKNGQLKFIKYLKITILSYYSSLLLLVVLLSLSDIIFN